MRRRTDSGRLGIIPNRRTSPGPSERLTASVSACASIATNLISFFIDRLLSHVALRYVGLATRSVTYALRIEAGRSILTSPPRGYQVTDSKRDRDTDVHRMSTLERPESPEPAVEPAVEVSEAAGSPPERATTVPISPSPSTAQSGQT